MPLDWLDLSKMMTRKIVAVTGHRPPKLGGYNNIVAHDKILQHMLNYLQKQPNIELYSGGALGIDQIWIEAGQMLGLSITAILPFEGYNSVWPEAAINYYNRLLAKCNAIIYVSSKGFDPKKFQLRNETMVKMADELVAYWDGSRGGTANCVDFARSINKSITIFDTKKILK